MNILLTAWKHKYAILSTIVISSLLGVIVYQREVTYGEFYQKGYDNAIVELTQKHNEELAKLTNDALVKEREMQSQLAKAQQQITKERENAKLANATMRDELNRLQSYIKRNTEAVKRANTTAETASKPDDEALSKGWALFRECSKRYADLATVTDEYRNDLTEWQNYGKLINQHYYGEKNE